MKTLAELLEMSQEDMLKRKLMFTRCKSKEQLHKWIKVFLKIDLPSSIVSESSNSSPMDIVWEIYDKGIQNNDPNFSRILGYACRGGYKSVAAAILQVLGIFHMGRTSGIVAAIKPQAKVVFGYFKDHLRKRPFIDFRGAVDKDDQVYVSWFFHPVTGEYINEKEFKKIKDLPESEGLLSKTQEARVLVCTMQGMNGFHCQLMVCDELDVVEDRAAYFESRNIPDQRDGLNPITFLTSTRKFAYGLVQDEIDEAETTKLHVRHWNIIDITETCEPERHRPEEPKVNLYIHPTDVKHITEDDFNLLDPASQNQYIKREGYAGCAGCPLFAGCKGTLATKQKSTSKLLKSIPTVIQKFRDQSSTPEIILSQLLCEKPETTGLVFPRFSKERHVLTANQIAERISGEPQPHITDKPTLIQFLKEREVPFFSGMDFGMTHPFSFSVFARWGKTAYVIDSVSESGLEVEDKMVKSANLRDLYEAQIFGDNESPSDIATFKKHGFRMRPCTKGKDSVNAGIKLMQSKLSPASGEPTLFFLAEDAGVEHLCMAMSRFHFRTDAAGKVSEFVDEEFKDEIDGLRYGIQDVFAPNGAPKSFESVSKSQNTGFVVKVKSIEEAYQDQMTPNNWLKKTIQKNTDGDSGGVTIKKKGFIFEG